MRIGTNNMRNICFQALHFQTRSGSQKYWISLPEPNLVSAG